MRSPKGRQKKRRIKMRDENVTLPVNDELFDRHGVRITNPSVIVGTGEDAERISISRISGSYVEGTLKMHGVRRG